MLHSTPISEPVSHILGFLVGWFAFLIAGQFTHDHATQVLVGSIASTFSNLLIGAKINAVMLDVLALVLIRLPSAWGAYEIFRHVMAN
jgi:hypothetical protein